LPISTGIPARFASKAHLPKSAPLRARASARYPAGYAQAIREEFPVPRPMLSRCLSATGIRFLSTLSRQGIQPPLRSAYRTACAYPRLRCGPWRVGSGQGAVPVFRPARFPGPPSAPGVPITRHRALRRPR
jgi:hypothetical protein